jgi:hypothetical protein
VHLGREKCWGQRTREDEVLMDNTVNGNIRGNKMHVVYYGPHGVLVRVEGMFSYELYLQQVKPKSSKRR